MRAIVGLPHTHMMPNIFIAMVDEKLLSSIGNIAMQSVQQMSTQRMPYILARNSGPTSCASILKGLSENVILPTGGGRYGSMLGFSRPAPTILVLATVAGKILRSILT